MDPSQDRIAKVRVAGSNTVVRSKSTFQGIACPVAFG
jgi:hypothetical protein